MTKETKEILLVPLNGGTLNDDDGKIAEFLQELTNHAKRAVKGNAFVNLNGGTLVNDGGQRALKQYNREPLIASDANTSFLVHPDGSVGISLSDDATAQQFAAGLITLRTNMHDNKSTNISAELDSVTISSEDLIAMQKIVEGSSKPWEKFDLGVAFEKEKQTGVETSRAM